MNANEPEVMVFQTSRRRVLIATLLALVLAGVVLVAVILPAEFNRDPFGVGAALGISGLSKPAAVSAATLHKEGQVFYQNNASFQLMPFEFVEYKYQLSKGSGMLYSWTVSKAREGGASPVTFDFHGESHELEGYVESYSLGEGDHEQGSFIAPFTGIHGWFWANHGGESVTVTLRTTGFYSESIEFRDGFVVRRALSQ